MKADNYAKLFSGAKREYMILKFLTTLKKKVLDGKDATVNKQND